jgi:hypothetical protein
VVAQGSLADTNWASTLEPPTADRRVVDLAEGLKQYFSCTHRAPLRSRRFCLSSLLKTGKRRSPKQSLAIIFMKVLPMLGIVTACCSGYVFAGPAGQTTGASSEISSGTNFNDFRQEKNGIKIGRLKEDMVIGGRPCKKGWLHLHANNVPAAFTAAHEIEEGRLKIPVDTWVLQTAEGVVTTCAFPRDTEVQGILCKGTGGAKGAQVAVYPSGALKQVFLARDMRIQEVPCAADAISGAVEFYEDGKLKSCLLSESYTRDGAVHKKGTRLQL